MTSTTANKTIDELRLIFASHGLPEELVSDNGPQFVSHEFSEFMRKNGIKHILVPPYHPSSNGAAERSVRVLKEALIKQVFEGTKGMSIKHRLANFLLRYRTTPHSTTGVTPAELMMKKKLRTRLSLAKPNLAQAVQNKQTKQIVYKDSKLDKERSFEIYDRVRVRNTRAKSQIDRWIPGTVVKVCGPRTYVVKTGYHNRYVHTDHMIRAHDGAPDKAEDAEIMVPESCEQAGLENQENVLDRTLEQSLVPDKLSAVLPVVPDKLGPEISPPPNALRRSQRIKKPVDRLNL